MALSADYASLFNRYNPFYSANQAIWQRSRAAYGGGRRYISIALIRHLAEIDIEFAERIARGYYINYPRRVARIITQYAIAQRPERINASPDYVEDWSRTGLRVDEVMRQVSTMLNVFGCAWLCVDMPAFDGVKTMRDEIAERLRPYCVALSPLDVVDWCYGEDGKFLWVLTKERRQDRSDPFKQPVTIDIRRLWTRQDVTVVANYSTGETNVRRFEHSLGVVPLLYQCEVDGYGMDANHWFEDVVSISDAILNNESEAQMNIVKQMFGMLVVSESFANNASKHEIEDADGNKTETTAQVIARSVAIIESPEDKGVSRYISPSGTENATIREDNQRLKREMFEMIGLALSKETKLVESSESKLWDFQGVEQYLKTRADMLEQLEIKAWEMMHQWNPSIPVPSVNYNRNFAVLDLKDAIASLLELSSFNAENEAYQKEVGKTATVLLNRLRQISQEAQDEIAQGIEDGEYTLHEHEQHGFDDGEDGGGVDESGV